MTGEKLKAFVIKKFKIQQDKLSPLMRKHGVAHEEKSDKELKNSLGFWFKLIVFVFLHFFDFSYFFVILFFFSF